MGSSAAAVSPASRLPRGSFIFLMEPQVGRKVEGVV